MIFFQRLCGVHSWLGSSSKIFLIPNHNGVNISETKIGLLLMFKNCKDPVHVLRICKELEHGRHNLWSGSEQRVALQWLPGKIDGSSSSSSTSVAFNGRSCPRYRNTIAAPMHCNAAPLQTGRVELKKQWHDQNYQKVIQANLRMSSLNMVNQIFSFCWLIVFTETLIAPVCNQIWSDWIFSLRVLSMSKRLDGENT